MRSQTPTPDDRPLLKVPEVAAILQISVDQAYRLCGKGGVIPSVVLGSQTRRVRPQDLDAWIADRVQGSAA